MILAEGYWHGDEYIPEIVDDPWANLQRVARVLGRDTECTSTRTPGASPKSWLRA
jgi:hypothetical protein